MFSRDKDTFFWVHPIHVRERINGHEMRALISSHLIQPHLISPHLISSHLIPTHLILPHLIPSHLIPTHLIPPQLTSSHFILSHLISSHLTSSHPSGSARIVVLQRTSDIPLGEKGVRGFHASVSNDAPTEREERPRVTLTS